MSFLACVYWAKLMLSLFKIASVFFNANAIAQTASYVCPANFEYVTLLLPNSDKKLLFVCGREYHPLGYIKKEKEEERDLSRCLFSSLLLHLYLFFHASKLYSILRIIELFVNVTYRSWNFGASRFVSFFPPSNVINDTRVGRQLDCSNVEN